MSTKARKNSDNWRFPKIPVHKIYNKNPFKIFPSYVIKDTEQTFSLDIADKCTSIDLISYDLLKGVNKKKHKFLHLGLVQVAVKPLVRDGLDAPVIVCLRDARQDNFKNSLLALVESNLSEGPFYFNCFPSFCVSLTNVVTSRPLVLFMKTPGIPLALTVRVVCKCKAMVDLKAEYLTEPMLGKTIYFQGFHDSTTVWDYVVQDNGSTQRPNDRLMLRGVSSAQ